MLGAPLRWKKPRRVFVSSMSDLFHEALPDQDVADVFRVMSRATWHTFQVLTKRAERMAAIMPRIVATFGPLPNVWLGVSVENQAAADKRIPFLLSTPAAVRFLSCEPLLGPVDLSAFLSCPFDGGSIDAHPKICDRCGRSHEIHRPSTDWVIVGGESGPGARPMHPDWARGIRDACTAAGVAFFFKQWGDWAPVGRFQDVRSGDEWLKGEAPVCSRLGDIRGHEALIDESTWLMVRVGKKDAGRLLDGGRTWDEMPGR